MKEYAVGSICVLFKSKYRPENVGKEVTILSPLQQRWFASTGFVWVYQIELQGAESYEEYAFHENLKLKRPPKDEKFEEFMQNVLKRVGLPEEDLV